jgi:hypothetical protein
MKLLATPAALIALTLAATALPFLPGRYDSLAIPLSGIAFTLGISSLLLIPVGLAWLIYEWRPTAVAIHRARAGFIIATLVIGSLAVFLAALLAVELSSLSLAVVLLTAWLLALWRYAPRLMTWSRRPPGRDLATPLALILLPIIIAGAQLALATPLKSFAQNRTMTELAPLIADIEQHRTTNGNYPRSLFSTTCDYRPHVIGVRGYQYEPTAGSYNLAIEVPTFSLTAQEFLVYNPTDTHALPSHDAFALQLSEAEQANYRGYFSKKPPTQPHWAVLLYD